VLVKFVARPGMEPRITCGSAQKLTHEPG